MLGHLVCIKIMCGSNINVTVTDSYNVLGVVIDLIHVHGCEAILA